MWSQHSVASALVHACEQRKYCPPARRKRSSFLAVTWGIVRSSPLHYLEWYTETLIELRTKSTSVVLPGRVVVRVDSLSVHMGTPRRFLYSPLSPHALSTCSRNWSKGNWLAGTVIRRGDATR
jgi:hypothetical protein